MNINWYPGHMAKAKRLMSEQLKNINVVVEILDARIPISSRNPEFEEMFDNKIRVVILNKSDLADERHTAQWIQWYKNRGYEAIAYSSNNENKNKILNFIEQSSQDIIKRYKAKGMNKVIRCMIVGIPNSGKSSFINKIAGKGKVKTEDRPGVTKSNQWIKISPMLEFMDTPGVLWPKFEDEKVALNLSYVGSIKDAILDTEELACGLLKELSIKYSDLIEKRYGIEPLGEGYEILEQICKKRGFMLKKNEFDYLRGAVMVLDEFRGNKMGRITLETTEDLD